jgi:hypothetical protein
MLTKDFSLIFGTIGGIFFCLLGLLVSNYNAYAAIFGLCVGFYLAKLLGSLFK